MSQIVQGMEQAHQAMVQWTIDQAHQMDAAIGPRPIFQEKQPERTQARQGALMYDDPQAWQQLLQAHGWQGPGSPVPKAVVEYGQRLTRLMAKYPDEAEAGKQAQAGQAIAAPLSPPGAATPAGDVASSVAPALPPSGSPTAPPPGMTGGM